VMSYIYIKFYPKKEKISITTTHMSIICVHLDGFGLLLGLGMGRHVKIRGEAGGLGKVENLR
jgi:hypothetical protein